MDAPHNHWIARIHIFRRYVSFGYFWQRLRGYSWDRTWNDSMMLPPSLFCGSFGSWCWLTAPSKQCHVEILESWVAVPLIIISILLSSGQHEKSWQFTPKNCYKTIYVKPYLGFGIILWYFSSYLSDRKPITIIYLSHPITIIYISHIPITSYHNHIHITHTYHIPIIYLSHTHHSIST